MAMSPGIPSSSGYPIVNPGHVVWCRCAMQARQGIQRLRLWARGPVLMHRAFHAQFLAHCAALPCLQQQQQQQLWPCSALPVRAHRLCDTPLAPTERFLAQAHSRPMPHAPGPAALICHCQVSLDVAPFVRAGKSTAAPSPAVWSMADTTPAAGQCHAKLISHLSHSGSQCIVRHEANGRCSGPSMQLSEWLTPP